MNSFQLIQTGLIAKEASKRTGVFLDAVSELIPGNGPDLPPM